MDPAQIEQSYIELVRFIQVNRMGQGKFLVGQVHVCRALNPTSQRLQ